MGFNFRTFNRDQLLLLPPSLHDWLPEDHLAWFLVDAVDQMDLTPLLKRYRADGWGGSSYDPAVMLCLLLYAYCIGERSSRRIERLCQEDVGFRVVSANLKPDHATIARFRQRHEKEVAGLFIDVLKLCHAAGLVKVGKVSLDGTKMEANASYSANRTYVGLQREVEKMLSEAEATDREEDETHGPGSSGNALPKELRNRQQRLERFQACKRRLEQEAAERAAEQQAKVDERRAKEEATGKKLRGRRPKAPDTAVDEKARANPTDPDSRIMTTRRGHIQGYNAQAVVTEDQIILAAELTQVGNDFHQTVKNTGEISDGLPEGLSPRERMALKLSTREGWEIYKTRAQTVEPTFGQIKDGRGCDRFMRRGLPPCDSEWKLLCLTHNLLKLWRHATGRLRLTLKEPVAVVAAP